MYTGVCIQLRIETKKLFLWYDSVFHVQTLYDYGLSYNKVQHKRKMAKLKKKKGKFYLLKLLSPLGLCSFPDLILKNIF